MPRENGYQHRHKPRLSALLSALRLDACYHRAAGDFVYAHDANGTEIRVLDLVGGYGSLILGHYHPELVRQATDFFARAQPVFVQGSRSPQAQALAENLADRCHGDYCVVFGNSGSEAVEAALKHAMLETGGRTFLTVEGAFHGKTLGSVQLTANETFRGPFELSGLKAAAVRMNDVDHLEEVFANETNLAGFVFEPIRGEGGVHQLAADFVRRAAELCDEHGIPLIADECQTGCGRTGHFLACHQPGVQPDYVVLAKSLGGGIAKISATLIQRSRYQTQFDLSHSSTFAADGFSIAIATRTLELIDNQALATCRETGAKLLRELREVQDLFPQIIADVRGAGLMLGVEFHSLAASSSFLLRFLSAQDALVHAISAYLLNRHQIRVAATLSDPFTLRIQPSLHFTAADQDRFLKAVGEVCDLLSKSDALALTRHLALPPEPPIDLNVCSDASANLFAIDAPRFQRQQQSVPATRVAWLFHGVDVQDLVAQESAFAELDDDALEHYLERLSVLANPVVMSGVDIGSRTGQSLRLYPIMLPVTSRWMLRRLERDQRSVCRDLIEQGLDVARSLSCSVAALGQYTSIVTRNGRGLDAPDLGLTTGNSYSTSLAIQAVRRAQRERGCDPSQSVLAIAGAVGNVGRTCAEILAGEYRRTILLGSNRPGSLNRLRRLASELPGAEISTDPTALATADVVMAATSSVERPLGPDCFRHGTIVCDVSVPPSLQRDMATLRPDMHIIKGGIVRLPCGEDLQIRGFPLPAGYTYGCMAEGILLGFEGVTDNAFTGTLSASQVTRTEQMAARHGFELADRQTCLMGSERRTAYVETR